MTGAYRPAIRRLLINIFMQWRFAFTQAYHVISSQNKRFTPFPASQKASLSAARVSRWHIDGNAAHDTRPAHASLD